jgi:hypothetical protein
MSNDTFVNSSFDNKSCTPAVTWSADNSFIITASYDGKLRWYDVKTNSEKHKLFVSPHIHEKGGQSSVYVVKPRRGDNAGPVEPIRMDDNDGSVEQKKKKG